MGRFDDRLGASAEVSAFYLASLCDFQREFKIWDGRQKVSVEI